MKNKKSRVTLDQRLSVHRMGMEGKTIREIAEWVKLSLSTVHNVLHEYRTQEWHRLSFFERAQWQDKKVSQRKRCKVKIGRMRDSAIKEYVRTELKAGNSPAQISAGLWIEHCKRYSKSAIYNYIHAEAPEWRELLFERGKKRRARITPTRKHKQMTGAPVKRPLELRGKKYPAATLRSEAGHLEADTVVSKKGGSKRAVLVLCCRATRRYWLRFVANLESETVMGVLAAFIKSQPPGKIKTITFDNGTEFCSRATAKLEKMFPGLEVFYCDPYSPQQKGSVENRNKVFRRAFPKKTDFQDVSSEELAATEKSMNSRRFVCLNWKTPEHCWQQPCLLAA